MKVKIVRSVTGYNTENWIPENEICFALEMKNPSYIAVEYEERMLIIPRDAIEVISND